MEKSFNREKESLNHTQNSISNSRVTNPNYMKQSSIQNNAKPYLQAMEDYRKLCLKTYSAPNNNFITTLKQESLNMYLDSYNLKEINVINKIIGEYHYFKQIILAPYDIHSKK
jgi:hypothetical protein